jgi:hypothetical protein
VPQALTYLIDDVARRHGGLRAGTAGAYLRSDDETLVAEAYADRRLAPLAFRRLAPTVLVTAASPGRLLEVLRGAGYAPVREDATGAAVLSRPRARRAPNRAVVVARPRAIVELRPAQAAGIVEQIRRGDAAARAQRRAPDSVRGAPPAGAASNGRTRVGHGGAAAGATGEDAGLGRVRRRARVADRRGCCARCRWRRASCAPRTSAPRRCTRSPCTA